MNLSYVLRKRKVTLLDYCKNNNLNTSDARNNLSIDIDQSIDRLRVAWQKNITLILILYSDRK